METYTFHNYSIGLTAEMNDDQIVRLLKLLEGFARETYPDLIPGGVVWGKTDEMPLKGVTTASIEADAKRLRGLMGR